MEVHGAITCPIGSPDGSFCLHAICTQRTLALDMHANRNRVLKEHPMAAKKTAKMTKAAFVRSLPTTTPAKEVVAKAKEAGIEFLGRYGYHVPVTSQGAQTKGAARPPKGSQN